MKSENIKDRDIMIKNLYLDCENFYKSNFVNSYKGFYLILSISLLKFLSRKPEIYFIKNNQFIPKQIIKQNRIIKVKPVMNEFIKDDGDKFSPLLKLKHEPNLKFLNFGLNKQESTRKELEKEEYLELKLAGIDYISKEGKYFLQKFLLNKNYKFYSHFNDISNIENINPDINTWILYKPKLFSFSKPKNLNILIIKNGLGKVTKINTDNIYDERIFYYYTDIIQADKTAKAKGLGIWRNSKSNIVADAFTWSGITNYIVNKYNKHFHNNKWTKIIMRKNIIE